MNLQKEIKALKERIAELEEQVKAEQEFPKDGDDYWFIDDEGWVDHAIYNNAYIGGSHKMIGNVFQNQEQAEFAFEKLKVEAELRKYSRPFKNGIYNHFIEFFPNSKKIDINTEHAIEAQGVIYFESEEKAQQAIETVGEERIKKYIFGVED